MARWGETYVKQETLHDICVGALTKTKTLYFKCNWIMRLTMDQIRNTRRVVVASKIRFCDDTIKKISWPLPGLKFRQIVFVFLFFCLCGLRSKRDLNFGDFFFHLFPRDDSSSAYIYGAYETKKYGLRCTWQDLRFDVFNFKIQNFNPLAFCRQSLAVLGVTVAIIDSVCSE